MRTRRQIEKIREQVDQISAVTNAETSPFKDDPCGLMTAAGMPPDPWQRKVLESDSKQKLLCVTRQGGKTSVVAGRAYHTAAFKPMSTVLILAPSERQSKELLLKVRYLHYVSGEIVPTESSSALKLELVNGSRIMALPSTEGTVRTYTADLLILDEGARVPDNLYYSVRPMIAVSAGEVIALSTPWGKRGWFYDEWMNGGSKWERTQITAHDCDRIPPDFLEDERRRMPEALFNSEYLCIFGDTISSLFTEEEIESMFSGHVPPLTGLEHMAAKQLVRAA